MDRTIEDARGLLRAAQEIHAERHGAQAFTLGTHVPLEAAAQRMGISPDRFRYYDAVKELEYEAAVEWDTSARYARGTSTTSSPSAAWTCCANPVGARGPRKFKLVG